MKVVMIGPFAFKPKGTVHARAFLIAQALVRRGHQTIVLMPPYDHPEDSGKAWLEKGVWLENAALPRDDMRHRIAAPLWLARRAARLRPDVVHVFKPIGYSGLAGMVLKRFSRCPLVLDTDDWEGRGGWSDVNPYPAAWKRFFAWQERWLAQRADAVTVASRTLQAQVWGWGVEPARVAYLPNGPDPALRTLPPPTEAQKAELRARWGVGDAPLALYLGHIPHGNDLDLALAALARVCQALPEARLAIAGVGAGLPGLQSAAQALGVADRVAFPGWIEPEQVPVALAAADVAVNPYRDNLITRSKCSAKVIAAMAAGKAVVTARLGENLEYIEHGRSGLLAEPGDPEDLARALEAVLRDRAWAAELGRNARERIWARYGWDARAGLIEGVYAAARRARGLAPARTDEP